MGNVFGTVNDPSVALQLAELKKQNETLIKINNDLRTQITNTTDIRYPKQQHIDEGELKEPLLPKNTSISMDMIKTYVSQC
jgi:hypothetical protein